jgi:hypothetical protein
MRKFLRLSILILSIFILTDSYSQCPSSGGSSGTITPTTSWQTQTVRGGRYYTFTVATCNVYTFTFCSNGGSASWDTQITINDNSNNPVAGAYNDDFCSFQSQLSWQPTAAGTYRVYITQFSCASNSTDATMAYSYAPGNTIAGDYALVGTATSSAPFTCVNLTSTASGQLGCAWDNTSTMNFAANFSYDFTVNLGSDPTGADGMTFILQNDPRGRCACGNATGGSLGATGITNSLIVEIDTYLNAEDRDDGMPDVLCAAGPNPDHLDIWTNGNINPAGTGCPTPAGARIIPAAAELLDGGVIYPVKNGLNHILRISWVAGSPGTLTATLMNTALTKTYGTVSYTFTANTLFGTNTPFFGFSASTGLLTNQQSVCFPAVLLPLALQSFDAKCHNGKSQINWTTASENNNHFFTVERSTDGIDYTSVGTVQGAGNSSQVHHYTFTDIERTEPISYYRLRQTDYDGRSRTYSIVAVHNCTSVNPISIFPNPFTDYITITPQMSSASKVLITIVNDIGQKVYELPTTLHEQKIDLHFLPKGEYFLRVVGEGISFGSKIMRL